MTPLPIHLKAAALGLAALIALSGAAALHAASPHIPRAAASPPSDTDTDTDNDDGCEINPRNIC